MTRINVGLIGLGDMGKTHLQNCMIMKNVHVVAAADRSKKSRKFARACGVAKVYDDFRKVVENPKIDCAIIALPNFLHAESAIMAAENHKHILLEKPLARNVKEGKHIVSAVKKGDVKMMIGYTLNFSPLAELRKQIDCGLLGDVYLAIASHMCYGPFYHRSIEGASVPKPVPSWWFDKELVGGGVLLDLGSHMVDLIRLYFGDEIKSVKAKLGYKFNMPFEDHATCFIEFKQGTTVVVNVSWCSLKPTTKVELFGVADVLSMTFKPQFANLGHKIFRLLKGSQAPTSSVYYDELRYFINCVLNDLTPAPSGEDGLKDLQIISLAYENSF